MTDVYERDGSWYLQNGHGESRIGAQRPRIFHGPHPSVAPTSAGEDLAVLARDFGMPLYPWQEWFAGEMLRERLDGLWAAMTVGLVVPRQNGKTALLLMRMLAGVLIFGEKLVVYSAHRFDTTLQTFGELCLLLDRADVNTNHDDGFSPRIKEWVDSAGGVKVSRRGGSEAIIFGNGSRIKFVARSEGKGRGFTGDCVVFDEASYRLLPSILDGLIPALSARANPQVIYLSSSGTADSNALLKIRREAKRGEGDELLFAEWSAPQRFDDPELPDDIDIDDQNLWYIANPALGITITPRWIESGERRNMDVAGFARERCGVWDSVPDRDRPIDIRAWEAGDRGADLAMHRVTVLSVDVSRSRRDVSLVAVGPTRGTRLGVLVVDQASDSRQMTERIADKARQLRVPVVVPAYGPAAPYVARLRALGVDVAEMAGGRAPVACAGFADHVHDGEIEHAGQHELTSAIEGVDRRWLGDGWVYDRRSPDVDATALWAATAAVWWLDMLDTEADTTLTEVNTGVS